MATDHLNGKRTGRPKGSKGGTVPQDLRRDIMWAYRNLTAFMLKDGEPQPNSERASRPPSPGAMLWLRYGLKHPERFLDRVVKQALIETKKKNTDAPKQTENDEGSERCIALCENWLADYRQKHVKENDDHLRQDRR